MAALPSGTLLIPLERQPIVPDTREGGKCIHPTFAILMPIAEILPQDSVITALSWLFKYRLSTIPLHNLALTAEQTAQVEAFGASNISGHILAFIAMGGMMTLAKEVRIQAPSNVEYLRLRWKALCATLGTTNIIEQGQMTSAQYAGIMQVLTSWQEWIKPQGDLRRDILDLIFQSVPGEPFVQGILDQVKMVLKEFGLKSVLLMEEFIALKSKAILLPAIARQAVALKKALIALREKHKEKFPYMRIYPLEGAERLNHRDYPDLYYAAVKLATRNRALGQEGRFQMSDLPTTIPKTEIEEEVVKKIRVLTTISAETEENLTFLGITLAQRRQRDEDEDEDVEMPPVQRRRI
ncbi:nucleocapsid [Solenopsis invicta virus 15]|uniref:Nucleocapsid n=1 Tax=Solenopsis invicta virus 15 TaxID=2810811 RepID=A0AAE7U736_9MONO|nr:nucleocapsid [Solenopsis invicta virus 15]QRK69400.1 nucleocapsid [Solenopsis invicta virus 15]